MLKISHDFIEIHTNTQSPTLYAKTEEGKKRNWRMHNSIGIIFQIIHKNTGWYCLECLHVCNGSIFYLLKNILSATQ